VRAIILGLVLMAALSVIVLSIRPGGLRRQLRFAARRLRLLLVLGTVYVVASGALRALFPDGPVTDFGPPALACVGHVDRRAAGAPGRGRNWQCTQN